MPKGSNKHFLNQKFCQKVKKTALNVSSDEWKKIKTRYKEEHRKTVTQGFFLHALSDIRKVPVGDLTMLLTTTRNQPERLVKRLREPEGETQVNLKKTKRYYQNDDGINPLIFESANDNLSFENNLTLLGVRITTLEDASPEKGYTNTKRTPNKTKVKPIFNINNQCFFTPFSPSKLEEKQKMTKKVILSHLPKINYKTAEPIEFTITKEDIKLAQGKSRGRSAKAIKLYSAHDFFLAHGLDANKCHFAHLQAHCLGGIQQFDNLIPSTAEANYNTLEAIELHLLDLFKDNKTDKVQVVVSPHYPDVGVIPDLLTYSLEWTEKNTMRLHQETFYITPQSTSRITKSMHKSLKLAREEAEKQESTEADFRPQKS